MRLFQDKFSIYKKAGEPLYKTPKSVQECIEILRIAPDGIEEIMDDVRENDQRLFYVAVTIIIKADTKEELEATEETLVTIGKRNSCQIEAHYLKQREALNTALPIGVRQVETMRTLMTQSLAVLMPFNVQELYLPGKGGTYYGVNQVSRNILFGNRKRLVNGNGFIFGVPGSGKSFFAKMEMGNVFLNTDDDIIVIDPQHEYFGIAERFGGQVVVLSTYTGNYINPMALPEDVSDIQGIIAEKGEFMLGICEQCMGESLNSRQKSIIDRCVRLLYQEVKEECISSSAYLTVTDCLVESNRSAYDGGGIYTGTGHLADITGCTITGNKAPRGSAIQTTKGDGELPLVIRNCTITGNRSAEKIHAGGTICYMNETGIVLSGNIVMEDNLSVGYEPCDIHYFFNTGASILLDEDFESDSTFVLGGYDSIKPGRVLIDGTLYHKDASPEQFPWHCPNYCTEKRGENLYLAEVPKTYYVSYDANNSSTGTSMMCSDPNKYTSEDTVIIMDQEALFPLMGNIVKFGHDFIGWNTEPEGTGIDYAPGQETSLTENLYLYAKWEAKEPVTLTYIEVKAVSDECLAKSVAVTWGNEAHL